MNHFLKGYQSTAYKWEGEALRDHYTVKNKACFGCPLHCSRNYFVRDGTYVTEGEGPEYEAIARFASRINANDPEFMLYCNTLCNEFGLDEIAVGELISWLMELNNFQTNGCHSPRIILQKAKPVYGIRGHNKGNVVLLSPRILASANTNGHLGRRLKDCELK